MEKDKVEEVICSALARAVEEATEPHFKRSAECPPFSRYRVLIYRPSTRSEQEHKHFINCLYCKSMLRKCAEQAFHLPSSHLINRQQPEPYTPEDLARHLNVTKCEACLRRERYEKILSKFVQAGLSRALEIVRQMLQPLVDISANLTEMHLGLLNENQVYAILDQHYGYSHLSTDQEQASLEDSAAALLQEEIKEAEEDGRQPDIATLLAAGIAHQAVSNPERRTAALDYYHRAIALSPESFEGYIFLASALHEQMLSEEGDAALRKAVSLLEASKMQ